ncbi:hypothetical protein GGI09_003100 [Coemansia sp. S100]|nr:hypothetical protein LPJ71_007857 [Coemansia sp. S17]KAJ2093092.1 hypothetical protein GGI16_005840 [Coemansia sp. S142-1]KAJ2098845.1 hypothetical protein GGI09_003100 [Coemansia sp. S100]
MEPTATIEARTTPTKQESHEEHGANALEKTENEQIEYIRGVVSANNITVEGFCKFLTRCQAKEKAEKEEEEREERREREERVAKWTSDIKQLSKLWRDASIAGPCEEIFQQFMDEFAKPLRSCSWIIQAKQRQNDHESTLQSFPVEELEPETQTQALLCPLLNTCKEGMAKLSARWQIRTELDKNMAMLQERKAILEAQEVQIQKLRTHLKNAIANAVGNEAMTRKYEYMARTVDAVCNKPRHDAMADEAEKSMMALREKYRLEALPFPELLPP